jgi:hypothetical protein
MTGVDSAAKEAATVSVLANVWLFGKPGQELNEGSEVTAAEIRELAQCLAERLQRVADIVDKMTGAGWDAQMCLYDVVLSHPYVRTEADARTRLDDLGIDPDEVCLMELEDEDDFEDDEEQEFEDTAGEE